MKQTKEPFLIRYGAIIAVVVFVALFALIGFLAQDIWRYNMTPAQAAPATIRAQVAPLKTAVRQLKSGKWRLTLESTDPAMGRLVKGQVVEVRVR